MDSHLPIKFFYTTLGMTITVATCYTNQTPKIKTKLMTNSAYNYIQVKKNTSLLCINAYNYHTTNCLVYLQALVQNVYNSDGTTLRNGHSRPFSPHCRVTCSSSISSRPHSISWPSMLNNRKCTSLFLKSLLDEAGVPVYLNSSLYTL